MTQHNIGEKSYYVFLRSRVITLGVHARGRPSHRTKSLEYKLGKKIFLVRRVQWTLSFIVLFYSISVKVNAIYEQFQSIKTNVLKNKFSRTTFKTRRPHVFCSLKNVFDSSHFFRIAQGPKAHCIRYDPCQL